MIRSSIIQLLRPQQKNIGAIGISCTRRRNVSQHSWPASEKYTKEYLEKLMDDEETSQRESEQVGRGYWQDPGHFLAEEHDNTRNAIPDYGKPKKAKDNKHSRQYK